ncbi:hypothetical protein BDM02DRAFT_3106808 [Thelephora ganbajun]|uniref:Uncharacterized protein n=1 Tax=Thelephora ganbajun TaxID=370292 RepID=A0ACB6ZY09_THEGA|nr:hypothetical protein BDM02DRAFT_3106808 [Thelephora ganbajun]
MTIYALLVPCAGSGPPDATKGLDGSSPTRFRRLALFVPITGFLLSLGWARP